MVLYLNWLRMLLSQHVTDRFTQDPNNGLITGVLLGNLKKKEPTQVLIP